MTELELLLPVTDTGRKYGYIIWPKSRNAEVREFLGAANELSLVVPGGRERRTRVDWKHHRVSIGYSVTRGLLPEVKQMLLTRDSAGRVVVAFVEGT